MSQQQIETEATPIGALDDLFDPRFTREMNVAQRIHLAQSRIRYIQKDKPKGAEVAGGKVLKYSVTSHDKVTAECRAALHPCGIIYFPVREGASMKVDGNITMLEVPVRFASIDDPDGSYIEVLGIGFGVDPGDKGPGKAMSYAIKYALLKCLGLETGDDPDLDQEVQRRSSTRQRADNLETAVLACQTPEALRDLVADPSTVAISEALNREDAAAWRTLNATVGKRARDLGLNMRTGEITPKVGVTDAG
jgi:hypothetical protein